ncbi:MAG TPA: GNAT family N-acetyltransferase [Verrucomicrobiae bacterium]|nr:GNAT family N-acetyltransferase [Verrucomicrobiae bacterium]HTZ55850.1 GNAT family N-acetyltransferase [Candidatus Acidoferrum sp.]
MSYIETERLLLRTWMPSDAAPLAAIYGDPETMQYILTGTKTLEQTREAIAKMVEADERDGCSMWPVVLKESSELIGSCGLMKTEEPGALELGFVFAPAARGHGYALEAARGVLDFAFSQLRARRVIALVHPFNAPSIALVNTLGMPFDRVVRMKRGNRGADVLRYVRYA